MIAAHIDYIYILFIYILDIYNLNLRHLLPYLESLGELLSVGELEAELLGVLEEEALVVLTGANVGGDGSGDDGGENSGFHFSL